MTCAATTCTSSMSATAPSTSCARSPSAASCRSPSAGASARSPTSRRGSPPAPTRSRSTPRHSTIRPLSRRRPGGSARSASWARSMRCATTTAATEAFVDGGRRPTGHDPAAWARELAARGAGEIFLNSIDRDGSGAGYDSDLIARVADAVEIPVVACGGVGRYAHFPAAIEAGAAAAAAANIFHFFELSYSHAKHACLRAGIPMRPVGLGSRFLAREPAYDRAAEDARIAGAWPTRRREIFQPLAPTPRPSGERSAGARRAPIRRSRRRPWSSTTTACAPAARWRR